MILHFIEFTLQNKATIDKSNFTFLFLYNYFWAWFLLEKVKLKGEKKIYC